MPSDEILTFERSEGKSPDVAIFRVTGPLTVRTMFALQDELRKTPPPVTILDLTDVPYIDSAGMGVVINFYVHCTKAKAKVAVAGVNSRALELFRLTKVDTLIPMYGTREEAETSS
jgi:anti-sigma B factor antagonist